MPKKNPTRRTAHARKRPRNDVATPAEVLLATVKVIRDRARVKPPNRLIGDTPADTIATCDRIIRAVVAGRHGDTGIVIVDAAILQTVSDALDHARDEANILWGAADGMVARLARDGTPITARDIAALHAYRDQLEKPVADNAR